MMRLCTLLLGLVAVTCSGCCHYWGSCCSDWNCGYNANDPYGPSPKRCGRCGRRDCRHGNRDCAPQNQNCAPQNCCDPCGCDPCGQQTGAMMGAPITSAYDPVMNMGGTGCAGCASGSLTSGLPVSSAGPMLGGCATGNCGNTYNGLPTEVTGGGWTIQPTPLNEPLPAPPAGGHGSTTSPPANASSNTVPVPTALPTSVGPGR